MLIPAPKPRTPRRSWAKFQKRNEDQYMRSFLFVPADGGSKLDKAMASGADAVIIDLEDSIAPERKDQARAAALDFLKRAGSARQRPHLLVRINGLETGMTDADLGAIVAGEPVA